MNISAVVNSTVDSGVPRGPQILAFVDAAVLSDAEELPLARADLLDRAGRGVVAAVAGVTANFEMMNRILDAVGVPVGPTFAAIGDELGVEIPHLRGS